MFRYAFQGARRYTCSFNMIVILACEKVAGSRLEACARLEVEPDDYCFTWG